MGKAFQEEGIACMKVGVHGGTHGSFGDYQEFAMLQQYWGAQYEEPEIIQTWGEIGIFLPLGKEMY